MKKIRNACKAAIKNIQKEGTTDVELFNRPFELNLLEKEEIEKEIIDFTTDALSTGSFDKMAFNKIGHILVPKKSISDFRKCAFIDIVDEVKYLTMVLLLAKDIEQMRVNKSDKKVFSYRLLPKNGLLFDTKYHFTSFKKYISDRSKIRTVKVLIECDIANFYDRLNLHRLESILLSNNRIEASTVKLLNELLIFWANRDSYGLPIGSNASRILAEAALIEVDNYLISQNVDFCRFVDDYRIFAKDSATAYHHLSLLTDALNREGLFLNSHKTKVKDISQLKLNNIEITDNEVESGDSEEVKETLESSKIIRGYSGLIPTKFRALTQREVLLLSEEDETEHLEKLKKMIIIQPEELTRFIKIIVAKKRYDLFADITQMLDKLPQFIPYFTDVLIKYENELNDTEVLGEIKRGFALWFEKENVPEYILVYLVRVFSSGNLADKDILLTYFRKLRRNSGDYIGRALLESFDDLLTRGEVIEIRQYYKRADQWEKRQILKLIQIKLSKGEKNPFFKDIGIHNNDILAKYTMSRKEDIHRLIKK
ncbi:RNA-directed DNA polymerase [Listeria rustica]|uniref:RNA-directed DNA polymerase n=1 Tax=Listeria rustica TaxID=2713503 RepID=A0A7W1YG30_9LIST|nr:RNA-directed DNA polymerase [Listeria rustica]MBA3926194.1 RNA-directed DNA polymerase [Listeria rustica]